MTIDRERLLKYLDIYAPHSYLVDVIREKVARGDFDAVPTK